jgi:ABC transport system ATP-binding/permease protein
VKDFSLRLERGARLGLIGANGAGKTTLLQMLIGALQPDSGHVRHGVNLELVTLDQKRETLDPETPLKVALTEGRSDEVIVNGVTRHVMSYLKDFLFTPEQANTPLKSLSGGERGRLMLARALMKQSNLMVLDEPTNDLDLETLDLLQEMIGDYEGTVILISHDRDFLDRTVNSVIMSEGEGHWQTYAGGYSDMLAQRGAGVAARKAADKQVKALPESKENTRSVSKAKLSFKDKYALENLPKEIAQLEKEIAVAETKLADASLYHKNPVQFAQLSREMSQSRTRIEVAQEEWLVLEMKREALEG